MFYSINVSSSRSSLKILISVSNLQYAANVFPSSSTVAITWADIYDFQWSTLTHYQKVVPTKLQTTEQSLDEVTINFDKGLKEI